MGETMKNDWWIVLMIILLFAQVFVIQRKLDKVMDQNQVLLNNWSFSTMDKEIIID